MKSAPGAKPPKATKSPQMKKIDRHVEAKHSVKSKKGAK